MDDKCGNCGWDGKTPLDSGEFKMTTDPVWGKMGEWVGYKQDAEWDSKIPTDDYVRGCLIFYVDVGSLSPHKAEAYLERMKARLDDKGGLTRIKRDHEIFFVPTRSGNDTRVKYIPFN